MNRGLINKVTLLVSTFDAYEPCWKPFCYGLAKYWPDCPFPVYFITNSKSPPCGKSIQVGEDRGWSGNLRIALEKIETPYILYLQEDYWLNALVDTVEVSDYVLHLEHDLADYIRLYPAPPPDRDFAFDDRLGVIAENAEYRASVQASLWRKDVLHNAVLQSPDGWHFERYGEVYTRQYKDRFLSVKQGYGVKYVFTAIVGGVWSPKAYEYARDEGITVEFDALPRRPWLKQTRKDLRAFLYRNLKRPLYRRLSRPRFLR